MIQNQPAHQPPQCAVCVQQAIKKERVPQFADLKRVECPRCGTYLISGSADAWLRSDDLNDRRHLLSGVLRRASDSGNQLKVVSDAVENLIAQAPTAQSVPRLLDDLLLFIHERTKRFTQIDQLFGIKPHADYPLFFLRGGSEIVYLLIHLASLGFVERHPTDDNEILYLRLTVAGWERAEALSVVRGRPDQAFVAMWFEKSLGDVYAAAIAPALSSVGYHPVRIDAVFHSEGVDDRILAEIRRSGLVVADFTGQRAGVYFEAGFAMGLNIPVLWCCREDEVDKLHFDTRQYPHILWNSPGDLHTKLVDRVRGLGYAREPSVPLNA